MRQDPDPWYSSEFWQRAVLGILLLALAYLLVLPFDAGAACCAAVRAAIAS